MTSPSAVLGYLPECPAHPDRRHPGRRACRSEATTDHLHEPSEPCDWQHALLKRSRCCSRDRARARAGPGISCLPEQRHQPRLTLIDLSVFDGPPVRGCGRASDEHERDHSRIAREGGTGGRVAHPLARPGVSGSSASSGCDESDSRGRPQRDGRKGRTTVAPRREPDRWMAPRFRKSMRLAVRAGGLVPAPRGEAGAWLGAIKCLLTAAPATSSKRLPPRGVGRR